MRSLIIAVALGFFAILAPAGTSPEPRNASQLVTATFPAGDPVIINLDTSKPFARHRRDGLASEPRAFTDI